MEFLDMLDDEDGVLDIYSAVKDGNIEAFNQIFESDEAQAEIERYGNYILCLSIESGNLDIISKLLECKKIQGVHCRGC